MSVARAADRPYYGVAVAIVTRVNDPERQGRVKVKYPWFDGSTESGWARVCQLYAGGGYGSVWVPEVDDEVLVAFEHGDMRFPIVLGGLYNGVDTPPTWRDDTRNQKLLRTKGGHEILLDDSSGQERVKVESAGGHSVTLDDAARQVVVESSSGASVTLDPAGTVTVKGRVSVVLDGAATATIKATSVTLDTPSVALGSAASSPLVRGDLLLAAFNVHTHNCTAPGTPSGPPIPLLTNAVLSTTSRTG